MRAISDISIPDDVIDVELDPVKRLRLVDNVLTEIVNRIAKSDALVTSKMTSLEIEKYLNVELWVALDEWEEELSLPSEEHTEEETCPMCYKAEKVEYLQSCLEKKWLLTGQEPYFKTALKFRCEPIEEGRKLN